MKVMKKTETNKTKTIPFAIAINPPSSMYSKPKTERKKIRSAIIALLYVMDE